MNGHEVALWSALAAFFGYLLATGLFEVLNVDRIYDYLGAFIVAGITAGAVYSKERLDEAKREREAAAEAELAQEGRRASASGSTCRGSCA